MAVDRLTFSAFSFKRKTKYLQLQAKNVDCVIELKRVEKVVSLMELISVPFAPSYLVGVFDYHGFIVPVIDLALRMGQENLDIYDVNSSVVLCKTLEQDTLLGLIVTNVGEVREINGHEFQLSPELSNKPSPLSACYKLSSQICYLLDADILIDSSLSDFEAILPSEINQILDAE